MEVYLAADGGGTKLQLIAYNDKGQVVGHGRMSGVNTILRSQEEIAVEMQQLLKKVIPETVTELSRADICLIKHNDVFASLLKRDYGVKQIYTWNEGETALASAGYAEGVVAQAGTGSDGFYIQEGVVDIVGGCGYIFGDEGSGYDIGRNALKAAIYAYDGRGPKTAI